MKKSLLYDSSARLVQQTQISGSSHHLTLRNLETGMYHIKLVGDDYNLCEKLLLAPFLVKNGAKSLLYRSYIHRALPDVMGFRCVAA